jgi:CRISPR-associated protein Csd1
MILKALYDYYNRCKNLPKFGFVDKQIPFIIVIDKDGLFKRIESHESDENNNNKTYRILKGANNATSGININVFWGKAEYLLNLDKKNLNIPIMLSTKFIANYELTQALCNLFPDNIEFKAVLSFYDKQQYRKIEENSFWGEISKNKELSFLLDGYTSIIAQESEDLDVYIRDVVLPKYSFEYEHGICLITGKKSILTPFSSKTPIKDAKNGKLVAFMDNKGYDSYGKKNMYNAPISIEAEFAFSSALIDLTKKNSKNKINIGNRLLVYWAKEAKQKNIEVEQYIFELFNCENTRTDDDVNKHIEYIQGLFKTIVKGSNSNFNNYNDIFYFAVLAAFNDARIGIVYWNECTLKSFASNILKYFGEIKISPNRYYGLKYIGLKQILNAISLKEKHSHKEKSPKKEKYLVKRETFRWLPNLPERIIQSIIQGTRYPEPLLTQCILRIRAEQNISEYKTTEYVQFKKNECIRAAIIKAFLNRNYNNNQILEDMLDKNNYNQGYLCGRLFATLEYLQERSSNGNSIRSRYMNAASATPSAVFATILNLSVHHAEKLDKGAQIFFEQLKSEIIKEISSNGFPNHLSLQDQGRFMVGYYQQRQEFYTKKEKTEADNVEQ